MLMPDELSPAQADDLLAHFGARQTDVLALTRALVECESPSGDVVGSHNVVDHLIEAALQTDASVVVERIEQPGYGTHLCLRGFAERALREARPTLIIGHTDTVHPRGSLTARPWREEDGRIYAPGIFDMKANCALAVEALRAIAVLGFKPSRPIVVLFTCDEETGSHGGRALVEREARAAAQVLVLEPPARGGRVKTARKGTGMYTLRAEGRAAHAGLEPEKGISAILEMARQIERLHALNDPARGTTINVGVIGGGTRSNVVPAEAWAEVDIRFSTEAEAARLHETLTDPRPFDDRVRLTVDGEINRPPLERTAGVARLYEHARRVAAALGEKLGEASVGGASDGNFAAACGAPVLDGLGVDGDGAHADHEHIIASALAPRGALLAGLLLTL